MMRKGSLGVMPSGGIPSFRHISQVWSSGELDRIMVMGAEEGGSIPVQRWIEKTDGPEQVLNMCWKWKLEFLFWLGLCGTKDWLFPLVDSGAVHGTEQVVGVKRLEAV